jgi:hypothetical protein
VEGMQAMGVGADVDVGGDVCFPQTDELAGTTVLVGQGGKEEKRGSVFLGSRFLRFILFLPFPVFPVDQTKRWISARWDNLKIRLLRRREEGQTATRSPIVSRRWALEHF